MSPVTAAQAGRSLFLSALPVDARDEVLEQLEPRTLQLHEMLVAAGDETDELVFPLTAVCSVVVDTEEGGTVEAGVVGRDGAVPVSALLGLRHAQRRTMVQVAGDALIGPASLIDRAESPLANVGRRYAATFLMQASQGTACNRLHALEQRAARWLLQVHDRVLRDTFPMTHEFLALMLGAHRPSVTLAAQMLQRAGMVEYSRGQLTITDRRLLEGAACECYAAIRDEYERAMGMPLSAAGAEMPPTA